MRRRALLGLAAALAGPPVRAAPAAGFPSHPVRLLVAFPPGGSVDTLGRRLQQGMSDALRASVVVENQGGANTLIATRQIAASAPDGHSLLVTSDSLAINRALLPDPGYEAPGSFAPVTLAITAPQVLVTHPRTGLRDVQDYVARLRSSGGRLNVAVPGWGAIGHLSSELLVARLSLPRPEHAAYRGGAPATAGLLAGDVDALWITLPAVTSLVRAGRLRALAVTTARRAAALPQVPTLDETVAPRVDLATWQGVLAPVGTPAPIVAALNEAIAATLARNDVRGDLAGLGFEVVGAGPEPFRDLIAHSVDAFSEVIRAAGIRPEGA
ncbi:tripartite tricarboxylate transporter substrate binding protein [Roseomonas sp. OT10]|uniref:Bug family tripartite tricarboxylate transporter substrate binding protein n=1 Tax=Roseomonas cutis TaxID=2897332 RepID=UPI001E386C77|nr:tripartite tricarboxylate transporter substrate-binding protein [Roseomonas sp. OT10]UFN47709.1 tripartite tricarboxylate transporter substrate binding protein [Roseomonas sp. OT10]